MKKKKPDLIFKCDKCSHKLYVSKGNVKILLTTECPDCGEEAYENWTLKGEGDFDNK